MMNAIEIFQNSKGKSVKFLSHQNCAQWQVRSSFPVEWSAANQTQALKHSLGRTKSQTVK